MGINVKYVSAEAESLVATQNTNGKKVYKVIFY